MRFVKEECLPQRLSNDTKEILDILEPNPCPVFPLLPLALALSLMLTQNNMVRTRLQCCWCIIMQEKKDI